MATGILTANALDPRLTLQSHSATLGLACDLAPQPPCAPPPQVDGGVSAANIAEIAEAGADMFVAGSAIFNSAPSSPRSLPRPPRDAPRPPRAPSTSPPPPRARARDCRLRVVAGLASPWLTVVPLPVRSRGLQGHHRRHARGARQGPLPGQGQGRRLDRRLGRRLSVGRRLRG